MILLFPALIVVYFLLCLVLPPKIGKKAVVSYAKIGMDGDTSGAVERILWADDNEQALNWRLHLIASARESIIMTSFYFYADESGKDLISALLQAADRGVQIRILIDALNGGFFITRDACFQCLLSHPKVEFRLYNPLNRCFFWRINFRMHDKYLIADDKCYLLSGRNLTDSFLGTYRERFNVDRDVLVYEENPGAYSSLTQVRNYFEVIWKEPCNCILQAGKKDQYKSFVTGKNGRKSIQSVKEARIRLRERYQKLEQRYCLTDLQWILPDQMIVTASIQLLANPLSDRRKQPVLWERLCGYMRQGTQVFIQTPYIICNRSMLQEMKAMKSSGIRIEFLANAVTNGVNPFGCADYLRKKSQILDACSGVYEYAGGQAIHTKTLLIDDQISIIGSFNIDLRSACLDTELMLAIDSPELNRQLQEKASQYKTVSQWVDEQGKSEKGSAYQSQAISGKKNALFWFLRFLTRPFRYLL